MEPLDHRPRPMAGSSAIGSHGVGSNVLSESFLRSLKDIEMFLMSFDEENPEFEVTSPSSVDANCNSTESTDGTLGLQTNPPSSTAASKGKSIEQDTSFIELARESRGGPSNPPFCTAATNKLKRHWSHKEEMLLRESVNQYGAGNWALIAAKIAGRTGKQCRERWFNNLNPEIKNGPWCPDEESMLIEGHRKFGNRWSAIASLIPGRTENAVKNKWNTSKRKMERIINLTNQDDYQMGVSSNRQAKKSNLDNYVKSILFDENVLAAVSDQPRESSSSIATSSMEGFPFQNSDLSVLLGFQAYDIDNVRQLMANVSTPPQESSPLFVTSTVQIFNVPDSCLNVFSELRDQNVDHVKRQLYFDISSPTAQPSPSLTTRGGKLHFQDPQVRLYESYDVGSLDNDLLDMNESTLWRFQPILDFDQ